VIQARAGRARASDHALPWNHGQSTNQKAKFSTVVVKIGIVLDLLNTVIIIVHYCSLLSQKFILEAAMFMTLRCLSRMSLFLSL
jgi:hypothetical protein